MCALRGKAKKQTGSPVSKSPRSFGKDKEEDYVADSGVMLQKSGEVCVSKNSGESSGVKSGVDVEDEESKKDEKQDNEWSEVSPGRAGRSQNIQNKSEDFLISASKFSALNEDGEEGEFLPVDQNEVENREEAR